jgi:hypothetical protein
MNPSLEGLMINKTRAELLLLIHPMEKICIVSDTWSGQPRATGESPDAPTNFST